MEMEMVVEVWTWGESDTTWGARCGVPLTDPRGAVANDA